MTTETIHANRIADLLGGSPNRPDVIVTTRVPQPPIPPDATAELSYYVRGYYGLPDGKERAAIYEAVRDLVNCGMRNHTLTALATTYDADGEPMQQWKCEYDDQSKTWGKWK